MRVVRLLEALGAWLSEDHAERHRELGRGHRLHSVTRHMLGLFRSVPGARAFRRHLAENGVRQGAGISVLRDAIALVEDRKTAIAA